MNKIVSLIFLCFPALPFAAPHSIIHEKQKWPENKICSKLENKVIDSTRVIPLDPGVRIGKLPNGFTYYIRHNSEPQKRVQFYLVNKVGSILEDENQRGLAHFMEHMNFNGTRHFPKNTMVDFLQKAGVRFGADLNAYTGFDETVYELPIPSADPLMVRSGLDIMSDWAQGALLDSAEIEKERGIVLEEKRLGMGAQERISRRFLPILTEHSLYETRLPIGLESVISSFKPQTIRNFYHNWYRPNLQALIVVGDIEVDAMEKLIRQKFSALKNPPNEMAREYHGIPLTDKGHFVIATDKEVSTTSLEVLFKHKSQRIKTEKDYLDYMKLALFNELISRRFSTIIKRQADPAYLNAGAGIKPFYGGLDMFSYSVNAKSGKLKESVIQSWQIIAQIKRYGFTQSELDKARVNYLSTLDKAEREKSKVPSVNYVKEYKDLFLNGNASPGLTWEAGFTHKHIAEINLNDISQVMDNYMKGGQNIFITAPDQEKNALPDSITAANWINEATNKNLTPFKDEFTAKSLLNVQVQPGKVTGKHFIPELNITTLKLSNGLSVVLKPTDFKNDEILFKGFARGGTSLYDNDDLENASAAANLVGMFGLGDYDPEQLDNLLNGKILIVNPFIGNRSSGITGMTSQADFETALQVTYLQMTSPRKDSLIFNNTINGFKEVLRNRYTDPNNVFADTIGKIMTSYNKRTAPLTVEKLNHISLQKVYDIYKDVFADASGFTFVFVGNFSPEAITPLITRYLGSLPSTFKDVKPRDINILPPAGMLVKKVFKGSEDKATVRISVTGSYEYNPLNNLALKSLQDILQIRVTQHLREEESEVYSPRVQSSYTKEPDNRYGFTVSFGCAPKNADHLVEMVEKEFANLRNNGPDQADVEKFKAAYAKTLELTLEDNGFWVGYLSGQYEYQDDPLQVLDIQKNLDKITVSMLKEAAGKYLSGKDMLVFQLLPETLKTN